MWLFKVISLPAYIQRFLNLANGLKDLQVQALRSDRTVQPFYQTVLHRFARLCLPNFDFMG